MPRWSSLIAVCLVVAARSAPAKKPPVKPTKPAPAVIAPAPTPRVDAKLGTVEIPATVSRREHDDVLKGAIEFLLVARGGKAYESVFLTEVKPDALHRSLLQVGLKPGAPPAQPGAPPTGASVRIEALWKDASGMERRAPVEEFVLDVTTGKPLADMKWVYTGSKQTEDPNTNKMVLMASQTRNLVSTHREDPTVLLMNPLPEASGKRYKRNDARLPKAGTAVRLVFRSAE